MKLLTLILFSLLEVIPSGEAVLRPLQKRDSILIADQLRYGVRLENLGKDEAIGLPDFSPISSDTLVIVSGWQMDTVSRKPLTVFASVVLSPFEAGEYLLPDIPVLRARAEGSDTLVFTGVKMDVTTIAVDTLTFVPHDLKGQILYPLTFKEILPWVAGALALAAIAIAAIVLIGRLIRRRKGGSEHRDPAYIVALRELEKYRSEKFWAPDKQKQFYSGITDALKFYMDDRFGVDAPEMTTAELFAALKAEEDITPEMYSSLKDLFERADFVKFAKFTASDDDNAAALPLAVRFVTSTYQAELEQQEEEARKAEGGAE